MKRIFLIAFLLTNFSVVAQNSDTLCFVFSKQRKDSSSKNFVIERNDFVKVKLKNGTTVKGRISNISEKGFKLDTTDVDLNSVVRLGMNRKERRHIGQYMSAWILGIGATAAIAGTILVFSGDTDTGFGLMAVGVVSGLSSIYSIDLAYGKRKKFDLTDEKWTVNTVPWNSIVHNKPKSKPTSIRD